MASSIRAVIAGAPAVEMRASPDEIACPRSPSLTKLAHVLHGLARPCNAPPALKHLSPCCDC